MNLMQVLTLSERDEILTEKTEDKRVVRLIDIVRQKPDDAWEGFIDALKKGK